MLLIPAIEISNFKNINPILDNQKKDEIFSKFSDPIQLIKLFRKENAKSLYIIDVDSKLKSKSINYNFIGKMCEATDIPLQLEMNFRSFQECVSCINRGIYRLILSGNYFSDHIFLAKVAENFPKTKIAFKVSIKNNQVFFEESEEYYSIEEYIEKMKVYNFHRLVIYFEDDNNNHNEQIAQICAKFMNELKVRISIFSEAKTYIDLFNFENLRPYGVDSFILKNELYNNSFPCIEMWREIEMKLEF